MPWHALLILLAVFHVGCASNNSCEKLHGAVHRREINDDYTFMLQKSVSVERAVGRSQAMAEKHGKETSVLIPWSSKKNKEVQEDATGTKAVSTLDAMKESVADFLVGLKHTVKKAAKSAKKAVKALLPSPLKTAARYALNKLKAKVYAAVSSKAMKSFELELDTVCQGDDAETEKKLVSDMFNTLADKSKDIVDEDITDEDMKEEEKSQSGPLVLLKSTTKKALKKVVLSLKKTMLPLMKTMLHTVRSMVRESLNIALKKLIDTPPSDAELQKQVQDFEAKIAQGSQTPGSDRIKPPSVWVWLQIESSEAVNAALKSVLDGHRLQPQFDELSLLVKCQESELASLLNPASLTDKQNEVELRALRSVDEALTMGLAEMIQPSVLDFASSALSSTNAMIDTYLVPVNEIPAVGPLVALLVGYVLKTYNTKLWVQYLPHLITCRLRYVCQLVSSKVVEDVEQRHAFNRSQRVLKRAETLNGKDIEQIVADIEEARAVETLMKWVYHEQIHPYVGQEIAKIDSRRKVMAAAARQLKAAQQQGFQCLNDEGSADDAVLKPLVIKVDKGEKPVVLLDQD
jgi:hypothetical protein